MEPSDDNPPFDFFSERPLPAAAGRPCVRSTCPTRRAPSAPARVDPCSSALPVALVFVALVFVLVFALLVDSCAGESRHDAYAGYMNAVNTIAQESSADGGLADTALNTQGLTVPQMMRKFQGLAAAEQQNLNQAGQLSPPGRLRSENADLLEALQLRVLGLSGLAAEFERTIHVHTAPTVEALALSRQAYRLLASDIIWDDLFLKPSANQLSSDGVGGVSVPESHFLADPEPDRHSRRDGRSW